MIDHVRRAPQGTSVYPGRALWALVHAIDDDDLGAPARAEFDEAVGRYRMVYFDLDREVIEAVALGRQGEGDAAGERFAPAYERLAALPLGRGTTHASSLLVARAALRDGWGEPVRWLRTAEAFFGAGGHERLARRCRTMLREAGAPVPRRRGASEVPASLRGLGVTSREVDVLTLVRAGCTTKEIAIRLFLSTKTVERHLSSLFDRTGVRNRQALAEVAAAHLGDADR
jgi:DNA-binding CsgD family transcriptional regulator